MTLNPYDVTDYAAVACPVCKAAIGVACTIRNGPLVAVPPTSPDRTAPWCVLLWLRWGGIPGQLCGIPP